MADYIFNWQNSKKYQEQLEKLPDNLKGIYDDIINDYSTLTIVKLGKAFVAYEILAEMVRLGWKKG